MVDFQEGLNPMSHQRCNIIAPLGLWSTLAIIFKNSTALLF
jgi:hypothetical protein